MKKQLYKTTSNKNKAKQSQVSKIVAVVVALLCIGVGVIAAIPPKKEEKPVTISTPNVVSVPPTSVIVLTPPPVSLPASNSQTQTEVVAPVFSFSQEEIDEMGVLLKEWAEQEKEDEPEYGHAVALYFKDLDTGLEYIYNPEEKFFIASLVKAPHALYIYHLVETQQATLDDIFTVTPEMIKGSEENSGKIKEEPDLPKDYTLNELIYYMLRYSDTAAQRILIKKYPVAGYVEYATSLGLRWPEDIRGITSGNITAVDAGIYLNAMYGYIQNGEHGEEYKEHLLHTNNTLIRSEYPVAHKYGWDENAYHDMAVVYGPHPYLLAVLTDKSDGTWPENGKFGEIAKKFENIMQPKWQQLDEYMLQIEQ